MNVSPRLAEAAAAVRERPGLAVGGLAIGVADVASIVLVAIGTIRAADGRPSGAAIALFARLLLLAAVAGVLPGTYEALRREPAGLRGTLRSLVDGARRSGPTLFAASVAAAAVSLVVAIPLAVAAATGALGLDAIAQAAIRAAGGESWGTPGSLAILVAAALVASFVARLPVAFHDVVALNGDERPWRAWRASVRAASARRGDLVGYGLVRLLLLAAPVVLAMGAGFVVDAVVDGLFGVGRLQYATVQATVVVTFVAATGVARPVLAAYHRRVATDRFAPSASDSAPLGYRPGARALVACVVVLAAVGGVAGLRVADVGPTASQPAAAAAGGEDPSAVLEAAAARTEATSHAMTYRARSRDATTGEWNATVRAEVLIDRADRRLLTVVDGPFSGTNATTYVEEGRAAATGPVRVEGVSERFRTTHRRGEWTVATGLPVAYADEWTDGYPDPSLPWRAVGETDGVVTYEISDPATLHRVDGFAGGFPAPTDDAVTYRDGNHVRVGVDRDAGRLAWIESRAAYDYREDGGETSSHRSETTVRFSGYGSTDVTRPAALGPRSALALLADAVAYHGDRPRVDADAG